MNTGYAHTGGRSRKLKDESWDLCYDLHFEGRYGIPKLEPVFVDPEKYRWTDFSNAAKLRADRDDTKSLGVHFFVDDFKFQAVYTELPRYLKMMMKYGVVCAPDFSMFSDRPDALNIYAHYRSHAVAASWQRAGITVIPTANWVWESSYDWCFDGMPKHSTVAVCSNGVGKNADTRRLFTQGFNEMTRRLEPVNILWVGEPIEECKGNIFVLPSFSAQRWRDKTSTYTRVKKYLT